MHVRRAGGGPDRDRRLAGHGDGGGGSLSLGAEIRKVAAGYPESRSAILPALRLAQEEHGGWLPPEALREVADALELAPAQVEGVASFYDMLHLAPVGRHLVEVCTNLSCALVGAQQVLEAFERELGIAPGETSEDGEFTLRAIECAGGCGRAVVVVVDERYHEPVRPEDVPAIVEELKRAD
jgi:NADH-quinone oxidoreductase E subunit